MKLYLTISMHFNLYAVIQIVLYHTRHFSNMLTKFYNCIQGEGSKSTALNAVALQDHLMQQLSLTSGSTTKSQRNPRNSTIVNNTKGGIKSIHVAVFRLIIIMNIRRKGQEIKQRCRLLVE